MFSIANPFDKDSISVLSLEQKAEYLDLLVEIADKRKIPNITFETETNVSNFLKVGLIKNEVEKLKYWESGQYFLNQSDYDKLVKLFNEEEIEIQLKAFNDWKSPKKASRTNIYLTIRKWLKASCKFILSKEQKTFIVKSFDSYERNVTDNGNSKSRYAEHIIKLLEKRYTIEELRSFISYTMNRESLVENSDFRKRIHNVITEFETRKKVKWWMRKTY